MSPGRILRTFPALQSPLALVVMVAEPRIARLRAAQLSATEAAG